MEYQIYLLLSVHLASIWMQAIVIHLKKKTKYTTNFSQAIFQQFLINVCFVDDSGAG